MPETTNPSVHQPRTPVSKERRALRVIVGIGDIAVSDQAAQELITYSLGSCVGVAIFDPATGTSALAHFKLPSAKGHPEKLKRSPGVFVDAGMDELMRQLTGRTGRPKGFVVKVAGGARFTGSDPRFDIGKKNLNALRRALWKHGLVVASSSTGGNIPRTMSIWARTGEVTVESQGASVAL